MGRRTRTQGSYVTGTLKNPLAVGQCDTSGFLFNHKDLKKQYQWRGNNRIWTGLLVGPQFLDAPQEQDRPQIAYADPHPIKNPRYPDGYIDPESNPILPYEQLIAKLRNVKWGS